MQDKSCSQALCYSPNTLCHGRRVMLHLRHNKNRMWLKERQTKWASKSPMCLRRAANDGTSECWHTAGAHPPNPHPTHPPNSKRTGGGTAASVNTPQSTEWVTYDLGLSVCAVPIATWNAGYVSWIFFCVTGWGDGRRVRVGGWVGGVQGSQRWRVCPCSTLEAALTFGSLAWQRSVRRENRSHPNCFCSNDRFKRPLTSSKRVPVSLLQRLLDAFHKRMMWSPVNNKPAFSASPR